MVIVILKGEGEAAHLADTIACINVMCRFRLMGQFPQFS